jgi:uncharacterized membrane protein YccC
MTYSCRRMARRLRANDGRRGAGMRTPISLGGAQGDSDLSFIGRLFGGQSDVTAEDRKASQAILVQLNALRALQDDEAGRFNGVLAKIRRVAAPQRQRTWSSRAAAAYEGMYEGASPPLADVQQLLTTQERARQAAVKEEAKLLKRLRVTSRRRDDSLKTESASPSPAKYHHVASRPL